MKITFEKKNGSKKGRFNYRHRLQLNAKGKTLMQIASKQIGFANEV